ncbi:MAG TPA: sensory rhodopsin transducer [Stenotrophomonas sp.]
MKSLGATHWAIAEGYIPGWSNGPSPQMESHETCCVLNAGASDAHVALTLYFQDREPVGPYRVVVPARRTLHLRFNDLQDPAPVPRETPFATLVSSDVPVIVQHTRLDSRQPANSVMTTMAYPL